jgi:hypothetical protein
MAKKTTRAAKTKKKTAKSTRTRAKEHLHLVSASRRRALFAGFSRVLKDNAIAGTVAAVHITPAARAAPAPAPEDTCPEGQTRRLVLSKNERGEPVVVERCVPF